MLRSQAGEREARGGEQRRPWRDGAVTCRPRATQSRRRRERNRCAPAHLVVVGRALQHQDETVLAGALETFDREQGVMQPRQAAFDQKRREAGDRGDQNAGRERHQHEGGPGVERPAAAVVGIIDDGGIVFQAVGERRHGDAADEHGDPNMAAAAARSSSSMPSTGNGVKASTSR